VQTEPPAGTLLVTISVSAHLGLMEHCVMKVWIFLYCVVPIQVYYGLSPYINC